MIKSQAIYNTHPAVVTISDGKAYDKSMQPVVLDKKLVTLELARLEANKPVLDQIIALEASIDKPRMRREYAEGMRKTIAGVSPTAAEAWTIKKVQDVDNQIGVLRAKLK